MAFKELASDIRYPKYAELESGALIVEGKYEGDQDGKFGKEFIFTDSDGRVVLGNAGHLSYLMAQVNEGDTVRVEYSGKEILKKGAYAGKAAHRFRVLVDDEVQPDGETPF